MTKRRDKTTRRIELIISLVLQVGVAVSSAFIVMGLILFLTKQSPSAHHSYKYYTSSSFSFPHRFSTLKSALKSGSGIGFISLGVLLLILTPIVRVATSAVSFLIGRDKPMVLVTLFVLIVLISSFCIGMAVH